MLHSLKNKKGRKGSFILKVDLEKAYDRVDWDFLKQVLKFTGFAPILIDLIMDYVSSSKLLVYSNGETLEPFSTARGLRQGDPLSPYLFVLCKEILSHRICKLVEQKEWRPIKIGGAVLMISHIFFADDLLLFGEASFSQTRVMEYILTNFCGFSDQRVNKDKSSIWFSPNTPSYLCNTI